MRLDKSRLSWKKTGSGYLPPLPNADSPHTTATTKLLDLHYSNLRIAERWTWDRFQRLCSVMKLTEYEMASLCLFPHNWIDGFRDTNRIPTTVSGGGRAVALLLTMIEARVLEKFTADIIKNPMPNLNRTMAMGEKAEA